MENLFVDVFILIAGFTVYFLPAIVANGKKNCNVIFMLNLLLGWTLVGWLVLLAWALASEKEG